MSIDINKILSELESLPEYDSQIMLQTVEGINDPFYGTGRIKQLNHIEEEFTVPLFESLSYTNSIIEMLGMHRTRLMKMKPKTCYTYHRDPSKRIHIPIITNEKCMFIINDEVKRYPADGKWHLIDTTLWHTAINASFEERIHIVGCI
jgi:hypothetical protein